MRVCETTQQRIELVAELQAELLKNDIVMLEERGCADEIMEVLAAEHAARCETLSKAIEPAMGRALLLMVSAALLQAAKQIDAATDVQLEMAGV